MSWGKKKWLEKWSPAQILITTFLIMIVLGSGLLSLPIASRTEALGYFDALFTATSAVCVTGLVVVDTLTQFTFFGQAVILILIQLGGLGLMTMATMMAILLGRRISFRNRLIMQEALNQFSLEGMVKLIKATGTVTFLLEAIGAIFLTLRFLPDFGWPTSIWYGVFHSVSAFCNAGFDLMGNFQSLIPFRSDWVVNLVIMGLIICGGLGFSVLTALWQRWFNNQKGKMSLHARLALLTTLVLLLVGTTFILLVEWNNALAGFPLPEKLLTAMFQAVTTRTAGFSTLPLLNLHSATILMMIILMFIGASPGSTGGGVKTTTFGTLIAMVISSVRGHNEVRLFGRRIPGDIVKRAVAIITISLTLVLALTMALSLSSGQPLFTVLFESVSAFGTVGLSLGITSLLTPLGRILLIITMFVGRVGPLSLALALAYDKANAPIRYPEERIIVG